MESNFNRHLGSKLRMRRLSLGLTQTKVAQAINVTFQQIQKYEKGTNGISSLRIMQLANFLKVPVVFFFEDFPLYQGSNLNENSSPDEKKEVDLNYSFLAKLFANLDDNQKEKIFQVLKNTRTLERNTGLLFGSSGRTRTCDPTINSRLLYQLSYRGILARYFFL